METVIETGLQAAVEADFLAAQYGRWNGRYIAICAMLAGLLERCVNGRKFRDQWRVQS